MLNVGVSACLIGRKCNYDGRDIYSDFVAALEDIDDIELFPYCPEFMALGGPRPNSRIVGGDGKDVLAGSALVIDSEGNDITAVMLQAANDFVFYLKENQVDAVILTEGSPSCGSHVILQEEGWPSAGFKTGQGVSAAVIEQNGIPILSSLDEKSIFEFVEKVLPGQIESGEYRQLSSYPKIAPFLKK